MPFFKKVEKIYYYEDFENSFIDWGIDILTKKIESFDSEFWINGGPYEDDIRKFRKEFDSLKYKENIYNYYKFISYINLKYDNKLMKDIYDVILSIIFFSLNKLELFDNVKNYNFIKLYMNEIISSLNYWNKFLKIIKINMKILNNLLKIYYLTYIIKKYIIFSNCYNDYCKDYCEILIMLLEYKNDNYFIYSIKLLEYIIKTVNIELKLINDYDLEANTLLNKINNDTNMRDAFNKFLWYENNIFPHIIDLSSYNYMKVVHSKIISIYYSKYNEIKIVFHVNKIIEKYINNNNQLTEESFNIILKLFTKSNGIFDYIKNYINELKVDRSHIDLYVIIDSQYTYNIFINVIVFLLPILCYNEKLTLIYLRLYYPISDKINNISVYNTHNIINTFFRLGDKNKQEITYTIFLNFLRTINEKIDNRLVMLKTINDILPEFLKNINEKIYNKLNINILITINNFLPKILINNNIIPYIL